MEREIGPGFATKEHLFCADFNQIERLAAFNFAVFFKFPQKAYNVIGGWGGGGVFLARIQLERVG